MPNSRLPNSIFSMLVVVGVVQFLYYTPRLPESLASHFGRAGSANAWQTKMTFFSTELIVVVLATVVGFGIPRIIEVMPDALINLPNKGFWLSPDRRAETFGYLQMHMAWFGCALLAFLLFVMELVFRANLHDPPRLNSGALILALAAFLFFTGIWTVRLVARFSRLR